MTAASATPTLAVVKICGITRVEDAELAVACGANAIGFVFWRRSPRFIDPFRARAIATTLPPFVTTVGVFVDAPAAEINRIAALVPLGAAQLHGDERPEAARGVAVPVLKALSGPAVESEAGAWDTRVTLLVDAHDPERRGGTGRRADWAAAARLASRRRVLLAGGLTVDNVAEAVDAVHPFGIDVSSGVESAPGIKDPDRLRALFDAVRAAAGRLGRGRASADMRQN